MKWILLELGIEKLSELRGKYFCKVYKWVMCSSKRNFF